MPKVPKGFCPVCDDVKMKKKGYERVSKQSDDPADVYVCPECKGVFIPASIFGVR